LELDLIALTVGSTESTCWTGAPTLQEIRQRSFDRRGNASCYYGPARLGRGKAEGRRELDALRGRLTEASQRLEELTRVNRTAAERWGRCQAAGQDDARARQALQAEIAGLRKQIATAEAKNARLYQVGKEIIEWLSGTGSGKRDLKHPGR
jgi:seryl-tRNA synthetase